MALQFLALALVWRVGLLAMSLEQWLAEAARVAGDAGEACSDSSATTSPGDLAVAAENGDAIVSWLEEARQTARAAANRDHHDDDDADDDDDDDDDDGIFAGPAFSIAAPAPRRGRPNQLWQEMVSERAAHLQPVAAPVLQEHGPVLPNDDPPAPCEVPPVQATNGSFLPLQTHGLRMLSSLCRVSKAVHRAMSDHGLRPEVEDSNIAGHMLDGQGFHQCSAVVLAKFLDIDRVVLSRKIRRLASALTLEQRLRRHDFEKAVAESFPPSALRYYLDSSTYDETSKLCSVQHTRDGGSTPAQASQDLTSSLNFQWAEKTTGKRKAGAAIAKILQTQCSYGMVVEMGKRDGRKHWIIFSGKVVCPLQVMSRASAEVLLACLLENNSASVHSKRFQLHCRGVSCDQAAYNVKAEQDLGQLRGGAWLSMVLACDVHVVSGIFTRCFDHLLPQHTSGMIHLALSLRPGSALSAFKAAIRSVVCEKLRLHAGPIAPEATAFKMHVLQLCGGTLTDSWKKQTLLLLCLNGDWRNRQFLEYYVDRPGSLQDRAAIEHLLTNALQEVFASAKPPLYPRHRWTGSDKSMDALLLMDSTHGLLGHVYKAFLRVVDGASMHQMSDHDAQQAVPAPVSVAIESVAMPVAREANVAHPDAPAGAELHDQHAEQEAPAAMQYARIHAHDRAESLKWLATEPSGMLMAMRYLTSLLTTLMSAQLRMAGRDWETLEEADFIKKLQAGGGTRQALCKRYPLTVAAQHAHEDQFLQELHRLFACDTRWSHIPVSQHTVAFRSVCFRLLSRAGCTAQQNLRLRHSLFPIAMFKLIHQPELLPTYLQVPHCMLDEWSKYILQQHGGEPEFLEKLLILQACQMKTGIANVEAAHASIRRNLSGKSVQTHVLDIQDSGAHWVLQHHRRHALGSKAKKILAHNVPLDERELAPETLWPAPPSL